MAIVCKCQSQKGTTSIETAAVEADAVLLHAHYYRSSHWISHQRICNSYADIPCIFHHTRQDVYPVDE